VARALIEEGYTNVRPLEGGFDAWVDAGFPLEEGDV
jgi:rhodanese-related sulfurtransferase